MSHQYFAVTERQMKRWKLLEKVKAGKLTLAAVRPALGVSYRQAQAQSGFLATSTGTWPTTGTVPVGPLDGDEPLEYTSSVAE